VGIRAQARTIFEPNDKFPHIMRQDSQNGNHLKINPE
jgi:hypothetical protein